MNVTILAFGKLKEDYLREAAAEYLKRLTPFAKVTVTELPPVKLPDDPSPAEITAALEKEADAVLKKLPNDSYKIALCIEGQEKSSDAFAETLRRVTTGGKSRIVLLIGSSYGLAERVKAACDERLSFSQMTFPHQLARVMLLEQLYRACQINAGGKYHK